MKGGRVELAAASVGFGFKVLRRVCAGIEDDACHAHYLRILEAVMGALVWDVRGFGDNGWSGTRLQGLRNCHRFLANSPLLLLPPPQGLHRLPTRIPSPSHLHPPPLLLLHPFVSFG